MSYEGREMKILSKKISDSLHELVMSLCKNTFYGNTTCMTLSII